jgi:hypothetical protein
MIREKARRRCNSLETLKNLGVAIWAKRNRNLPIRVR